MTSTCLLLLLPGVCLLHLVRVQRRLHSCRTSLRPCQGVCQVNSPSATANSKPEVISECECLRSCYRHGITRRAVWFRSGPWCEGRSTRVHDGAACRITTLPAQSHALKHTRRIAADAHAIAYIDKWRDAWRKGTFCDRCGRQKRWRLPALCRPPKLALCHATAARLNPRVPRHTITARSTSASLHAGAARYSTATSGLVMS